MEWVYALVHFEVRENGSRDFLDCDLYETEKEAKQNMDRSVSDTVTVYSRSFPENADMIKSSGGGRWHDVDIPGECSENGRKIGITWEICMVPLPEIYEKKGGDGS